MEFFFSKVAGYIVNKKILHRYRWWWYYAIYHWFEKRLLSSFGRLCKICFPIFCSMIFPSISTSSRIIVTRTKQLLVGIRYLFLTMKQLFSETFGRNFELFEELWMLTSRLLFRLWRPQRTKRWGNKVLANFDNGWAWFFGEVFFPWYEKISYIYVDV